MSAFDEFDVGRDILESLFGRRMCRPTRRRKLSFAANGAERITGHLRREVIGRSCVGKAVLHGQQSGCEFGSEESLWLAP